MLVRCPHLRVGIDKRGAPMVKGHCQSPKPTSYNCPHWDLSGRLPPCLQLLVESWGPAGGSRLDVRPAAREMLMVPAPSRIGDVCLVSQGADSPAH